MNVFLYFWTITIVKNKRYNVRENMSGYLTMRLSRNDLLNDYLKQLKMSSQMAKV